ncbi:hypothetical protein PV08_02655 [Exophiala spinifera]|uniref:Methyltransferase type 11 domain-containing protein n=1 Tax=Exophiala spinifera TaxID=91928 RepID=A0A0D2A055_9EURO|nr:uncharacterized protein PV08_02655 [Exophiala spinifera]KIW18367.1 hypothetical protein PV08_02655 [Exophiala spinifera]
MADNPAKYFDDLATTYESLIGLITADIAHHILYEVLPAPDSTAVIHDNACGTGIVTQYLEDIASRTRLYPTILATDFVPSVVEVAKRKNISVMDSQALTFLDDFFDLSITNFGIFFLPEPQKGADHIYRTLKPGGVAVVTSWKARPLMDTIKAAQRLICPGTKPFGAPWEREWSKEETLRNVLENAGFKGENIQIVEKRTDAVYEPFMRDVHMVAKAYTSMIEEWREEDKEKLGPEMLKILQAREDGLAEGLCLVAYIAIAKK